MTPGAYGCPVCDVTWFGEPRCWLCGCRDVVAAYRLATSPPRQTRYYPDVVTP